MSESRKKAATETTPCPWCSAAIPVEASTCPSCGAALRDAADGDVAGVTQVDLAATSRLARMKPPGRIAQWLGAESTTDNPALAGHVEPPSDAVKQEMLRLEIAAIDAEIEAKNAQLEAERLLAPEEGGPASPPRPASSAAADAGPDAASDDAPEGAPSEPA